MTADPRGAAAVGPDVTRFGIVDTLRGVGALSVCWFHLTHGNPTFLPDGWLKASGTYGWLGVDVFFVISGFVVPLAMARRGYRLGRDTPRFIAKRLLRLDPPYLVAAMLALVLGYASAWIPGFRGPVPQASMAQVFAHVGYLNDLLGLPWLNPVFWSLAIEFQYYLVLALGFPALAHASGWVRGVALASVWVGAMCSLPASIVVHYLGLFGCGLAVFQFHRGHLSLVPFVLVTCAMGYAAGDPSVGCISIGTAFAIAWVRTESRVGRWFGDISYSLYLIHVPIGGRVINLGSRFADSVGWQLVVLACALGASITAALVLHRWVELPAQRWSARIGYRPRQLTPAS